MAAKAKKSGRLAIYTRQDKAILFIGYVLLALFVVAIVVPVVYIVHCIVYGPRHPSKPGHHL